jgi:hypothetical protein
MGHSETNDRSSGIDRFTLESGHPLALGPRQLGAGNGPTATAQFSATDLIC